LEANTTAQRKPIQKKQKTKTSKKYKQHTQKPDIETKGKQSTSIQAHAFSKQHKYYSHINYYEQEKWISNFKTVKV
jgi:hypothetical protein